MKKLFQWHYLLSISLASFILFQSKTTHADTGAGPITCTQGSVGMLAFGMVDPLSSQISTSTTLNYECKGNSSNASARICFAFGPLESTNTYRDISGPNNSVMAFNLFSDPGLKNTITSVNPLQVTFNTGTSIETSRSITIHAQTLAKQTSLFPGPYFLQNQVFMTVNSIEGNNPPANCVAPADGDISSTYKFPYTSSASVSPHCSVTTTGSLDLGRVSASTTSTSGSSVNLINVTCTNDTSYNIGLAPSNANINGSGVMSGTDDTFKLPYQLQSDVSGEVWGNNGSSYNTLTNGVTGKGNGETQAHTVYATVPNTDVKPDYYSDIVTINVHY
ncbi:spore coat U domain-containing protein [Psychrobacter sp. SWN149]|uniref:Csu type fimbrial protein n=1 Tax=Psychrobacter sp. SWN149 TaxID=2792057 RepID=UPI0018CEA905|nr:spore coat U domain-containing protein [Psychrobacter sp. SWN149]MBH0005809.1 spore coat protein U domain-containing protein [Psychrobacter sp. SWN149]